MKFNELKISENTLKNLEKLGYEEASKIQEKAIPIILEGRDLIGQAQTGTGKTAAFAIPVIEKTIPGIGIQHIILAPSRELAKQINDEFNKIIGDQPINVVTIIGGVSYDLQRKDMLKKPEIVIATPGRIIDHLESKRIPIDLTNVKTLVLDEADEMLNFGFFKEVLRINNFMPKEKQILLFTATTNKRTKELIKEILVNPETIAVSEGLSTNKTISQEYVVIKEKAKLVTLYNLLQINDHKSVIIFGRTKKRVDQLADALVKLGFKAKGIQGDMKQNERSRAMNKFRDGEINILIGTDVLARGIDVETVDLVFNFDLPTEIEYYTHRIGRTGRAGKEGKAISFVKSSEEVYFNRIMRATSSDIIKIEAPTDKDMESVKAEQLDDELSNLLHLGREKYRNIAAKIAEEYTPEHLGLIVAAATIGVRVNPYEIKLTAEPGVDSKNSGRSRKRSRSRSNGSSRRSSGRSDRKPRTYSRKSDKKRK